MSLAFLSGLVLAAGASAASDGEHPGPGEKIARSTVGTAPQSLTEAERAKLAMRPVDPAPVSVLRPAPWWPPEWRAQFLNGGARPVRAAAPGPGPHRAVTTSSQSVAGPAAHVTPRASKPPDVRTIGYGPRDASAAEIESKKAAASKRSGGR